MTAKELYEWTKKNKCENDELFISTGNALFPLTVVNKSFNTEYYRDIVKFQFK